MPNNIPKWRINLILVFIVLFGIGIITQLFLIQVLKGDFYKALAQGQNSFDNKSEAKRGEILFKDQEPLAINFEWPLVFASPIEIEEKEKTAEILAEKLGLNKDSILEKIQKDSFYAVIKKRLTNEEVENFINVELKGVYIGKESGRYYPQESLASQLVGFLGAEGKGQYGLEEYYDEFLQGEKGLPGSDISLTIDYAIQFKAEELLEGAKETLNIEGGEIIVLDPISGKVLALANFPNFNPNQYSQVRDLDIFQNAITDKIFEPGSVFKPITMAAVINEGKISPSTTFVDPGIIEIGGWPIYNYNQRTYPGEITMTEILEKSINTGAVFAQRQLGNNLFVKYIEKFGFFEPTGIDLRETYSENKEFKKGYEVNFATAAFGQGIEITPIQLVKAYSAIANGGKMVTPYVIENIKGIKEMPGANDQEEIISLKTASQVTAMLVSVVENGFSKTAQVPGYYVAGKTGTAQIAWSALGENKSGYSDKSWQSFIGYAPAFNPRFLILVKLNNPETNTAEYSAVPIFQKLAKYIIDYYQIPPDYAL